jgi:hypothetical protein
MDRRTFFRARGSELGGGGGAIELADGAQGLLQAPLLAGRFILLRPSGSKWPSVVECSVSNHSQRSDAPFPTKRTDFQSGAGAPPC